MLTWGRDRPCPSRQEAPFSWGWHAKGFSLALENQTPQWVGGAAAGGLPGQVPGPLQRVSGRPGVERAANTGPVWPWGWPHPAGTSPSFWGQRALKGHVRLGAWKAGWEEVRPAGLPRVPSLLTQSPIHPAHPPWEGHLTTPPSLALGGQRPQGPFKQARLGRCCRDQRAALPGARRGPASGICSRVGQREEASWGGPAPSPSPFLMALPRSSADHPRGGRVSEPSSGPWQGLALGSREVEPGQHPHPRLGAPGQELEVLRPGTALPDSVSETLVATECDSFW